MERIDQAKDLDLQARLFSHLSNDGVRGVLARLYAPAAGFPLPRGVILGRGTLEEKHLPITLDKKGNRDGESLAHRGLLMAIRIRPIAPDGRAVRRR
jgi:hypothetical protein